MFGAAGLPTEAEVCEHCWANHPLLIHWISTGIMIIDKKEIDSVSRFSTLMSGVIAMPQLGVHV
jgi:hypothetical protein